MFMDTLIDLFSNCHFFNRSAITAGRDGATVQMASCVLEIPLSFIACRIGARVDNNRSFGVAVLS